MATFDDLITNGFDVDIAIQVLSEADDLELVELPDPLEFLMEGVGLAEDEAVDLLCELEDAPLENAFYSAAQRKWYFANLGKKGGPSGAKGGKGGDFKGGKGGAAPADKPAQKPDKAAAAKAGENISKEPITAPPPGKYFAPDVRSDSNKDGVTDAARVGVPAAEVPPPPRIPRLPNLTKAERKVESDFAKAYEKDPDGMAAQYRTLVANQTKPPKFETDAAKMLTTAWVDKDINKQSQKRAQFNTALHQTANAIAKRAALQHMDTLKPGDEIVITAGGCGCHVADTPIMMADGSLKMVQDIEDGDDLMGPDSKPRKVLQLIRGYGNLYRVVPKKGKPFVVNEDHVLSVQTNRHPKAKKRSRLVTLNITVREYLDRSRSFRRSCMQYRVPVEFPRQLTSLDPYFLGVWLGNGVHCDTTVTTMDEEIVSYLNKFSQQFPATELVCRDKEGANKAKDYKVALIDKHPGKGKSNPVVNLLKAVGVFKNKHIPRNYLINDRESRLRLLAGLLDTDGYCGRNRNGFEFSSKSERMAYDVAFLSRSLGFAAYVKPKIVCNAFTKNKPRTYWKVSISGDVDQIPTKVERKQAAPRRINKNPLRFGFHLEPAGRGDFYGFTLEGDGLYLLDDFTVTHNSGKGYALGNNPEMKARVEKSKMVWDSAGDQNATENTWLLAEAQKRGLKVHVAYVHADPKVQWAHPERGVVKRASSPTDGRMVDAAVFADSYALGAKNMKAFHDANKDNPDVSFTFFDATKPNSLGFPSTVNKIPEAAFVDRDAVHQFALGTIAQSGTIPPHIKRGATIGTRIWGRTQGKSS